MPDTVEPRIVHLESLPLRVPLREPFAIASATLSAIDNVAVRVTLDDGTVGWGEIAVLPPVTSVDAGSAAATVAAAAQTLGGQPIGRWRELARELGWRWQGRESVCAGIEMALVDAAARAARMPLHAWFGGAGHRLVTDITIPICAPARAGELAAGYALEGYTTLKTKIGLDPDADLARVLAIASACPGARLVLDANGGYDAPTAIAFVAQLRNLGVVPALLEQPVAREDWDGLGRVARDTGVPVAADESCRDVDDVRRIAAGRLAQVVNVKLAKTGVAGALDVVALAMRKGLGLMIGGMVETRLAMGFAAHLAAGLGSFAWVDLDTPMLLAADPVTGGYRQTGPVIDLGPGGGGHGGVLADGRGG